MKKVIVKANSMLKTGETYQCDRLELKLRRMQESNEPIDDTVIVNKIYTERKDGVMPAYDIRTDRFDVAIMAMDAANKMRDAQRWRGTDAPAEDTATKSAEKNKAGEQPIKSAEKNRAGELPIAEA